MKPAPFEYFAPDTLDEALSLLAKYGDEAKILAGGQSLVPMMNFRLAKPECLIDVNRIPNLSYVEQANGTLRIGALTRHRTLENSALLRESNGLASEAVRLIGHPAIRTRGTAGGSISHADPTAELCALLAVMEGSVRAVGGHGTRTIPSDKFFLSYFTTWLEPTEMCVEIILPAMPRGAGWAFEEFTRRHGDFCVVGVAVVVQADDRGKCTTARIVLAGVGPTPVRADAAEQLLRGEPLTDTVLAEAGRIAAEHIDPESDLHASSAYRRHLARVLSVRALARARDILANQRR